MLRYLFFLSVFLLGVGFASQGQALAETTLTGPDVRPWMVGCVHRSYLPTPALTVTVKRFGNPGQATAVPWRAEIALSDIETGDRTNCQILMHELGHVYDWTTLTPEARQEIGCRLLGQPSVNPWWGYYQSGRFVRGGEGLSSPMERFAEAYSLTAVYKRLKKGPNQAWLDSVASVSYGLEDYFGRRQFLALRKYLRNYKPSSVGTALRDQRTRLDDCQPAQG